MKRFFTFMLALAILLTFAPSAFAADWSLPDGVPMYEPGCVVELDFGTFTVLEVGFAKEIVYLTDQTAGDPLRQMAGAFMAGDGSALLVLKGRLCNYSDNASFIANGIPAVAITMLPSAEVTAATQGIQPQTWQLLHTPGDSINSLTPESFEIFHNILNNLAALKTVA